MNNAVTFRHTINIKGKFAKAHKVISIANHYSMELEEIFNQWTKVLVTDK